MNKPPRILIVGGVAAGASAAAKARRVSERAEIVVFERGPHVSFANCGLPYYLGGEISERDDLFLQTPESLWKRFRIDVRPLHEVTRILREKKQLEVRDIKGAEVRFEPYDKLILAPGGAAVIPAVPGLPAPNVFTLRTVPDADGVQAWLGGEKPSRAVVVGAGFIGLEAAEALAARGLKVSIVELLPQVLPPFDADMAAYMAERLRARGIELVLADGLASFNGSPVTSVVLKSGREIPADLIILSIGVKPELTLAKDAGLSVGGSGGIVVDEAMRTSDPDIYAAGDAVECVDLVTGGKTRFPLAGPANKQGRVAGANAAGGDLLFKGALGTAIVRSMGLTAAKTGLSERDAVRLGLAHFVSIIHPNDHAMYYPGAAQMHLKLVVESGTGRLLGAQAVGEAGVDKRIDVLATALSAKMTVEDLEDLDLAYAPPFGAAKDPVVMAGFAASAVRREEVSTLTWEELKTALAGTHHLQLVDVRTPKEHQAGHIPGSVNLPVDDLRARLKELDPKRETVVYCRVGLRGYIAARILRQSGFPRVRNLTGGMLSCCVTPEAAAA